MTATFFFCALLCTGVSLLLGEYSVGKPDTVFTKVVGEVFSVGFGIASMWCLIGFVYRLLLGA